MSWARFPNFKTLLRPICRYFFMSHGLPNRSGRWDCHLCFPLLNFRFWIWGTIFRFILRCKFNWQERTSGFWFCRRIDRLTVLLSQSKGGLWEFLLWESRRNGWYWDRRMDLQLWCRAGPYLLFWKGHRMWTEP